MVLQLRNQPERKNFLTNASIPDSHSTLYANTFVANRLNEQTVLQLTTEYLVNMDTMLLGNPQFCKLVIDWNMYKQMVGLQFM